MDDILKSIKAFLYERTASPLFGAYVVAWSVWNYRSITILLSGENIDKKFSAIDKLYEPLTFTILNHPLSIYGELFHGVIIPIVATMLYIYLYPLLAVPVYEHSLKKQQELRKVKQKEENNRLLSIEESRELRKKIALLEVKIDEDTEGYRKQIKSLTEVISAAENNNSNKLINIVGADNEELDRYIEKQIQSLPEGDFQLANLFGDGWPELNTSNKQSLGKRLRKYVERGDFINISIKGKGSGNQLIYNKATPLLVEQIVLTDKETILLSFIDQEGVFGPPDDLNINDAKKAGNGLEDKGLIESTQDGTQLTSLGLEWMLKFRVENNMSSKNQGVSQLDLVT
ncbi:hypothetical protein A9Q92_01775 [Methylophaga sp. 42_8_T64]|nr:hypothetical protein A9Q92_01775 [Methylophaga sp. 42_8_T64]